MALFGAPLAHEDHAVRACYAALRMQERGARATATSCSARTACRCRSASASTPARSWCARSAATCSWTTPRSARPCTWPRAWSRWPSPARSWPPSTPSRWPGPRGRAGRSGRCRCAACRRRSTCTRSAARCRSARASTRPRPARARRSWGARWSWRASTKRSTRCWRAPGRSWRWWASVGVGKSRLCLEFARRCRARGCLVIEAPAVSYGRAAGYRPGVELHRRYFQVEAGDDAATIRDKVAARLRALDPELEEGVSAILWVLGRRPGRRGRRRGSRPSPPPGDAHGPPARHAPGPAPALRDDPRGLQWVDTETHGAMDALVEACRPTLLLAATYRPEYADAGARHPGYTRVRVDALEPPAPTTAGRAARRRPRAPPLKRLVAERTNGNPLFLEECVTTLVGDRRARGRARAYRLTRPVLALEVPATVRATSPRASTGCPTRTSGCSRPPRSSATRCRCACSRRSPTCPPTRCAAGSTSSTPRACSTSGRSSPISSTASVTRSSHDVAYESLCTSGGGPCTRGSWKRIERPTRTAGWPSRASASPTTRFSARCGTARWATAVRRAAAPWPAWRAGRACRSSSGPSPRSRIDPRTRPRRATGVDLRCDLHNALVPLGQHARSVEVLREAAAVAETLDDRPRLARALSFESNVHWELGATDEAARAGERALAIAEETRDLGLKVVGTFNVGTGRRALGDYRQALDVLRRNLDLLTARLDRRDVRPARHRGGADARAPRLDPRRAGPVRGGDGRRARKGCGSRRRAASPTA